MLVALFTVARMVVYGKRALLSTALSPEHCTQNSQYAQHVHEHTAFLVFLYQYALHQMFFMLFKFAKV